MTVQPHYALRDQQPEMDSSSASEKHGGHQPLTATLFTCRQYLIDTFGHENIQKLLQATINGLTNSPKNLCKASKFISKVLLMPETWVTVAIVATANSVAFSIPAVIMESESYMIVDAISSFFGSYILFYAMGYMRERYCRQHMLKGGWITANIMKAITTCSLLHTILLLLYSISMNDGSETLLGELGVRSLCASFSICSWLIVTVFLCPHQKC